MSNLLILVILMVGLACLVYSGALALDAGDNSQPTVADFVWIATFAIVGGLVFSLALWMVGELTGQWLVCIAVGTLVVPTVTYWIPRASR